MSVKICFAYPWATLGGVERVLINRLKAFKEFAQNIQVDILFFHDAGGFKPLSSTVKQIDTNNRVMVSSDFPVNEKYDLVFCIDCPQVFALCKKRGFRYVVECHTSYTENRRYLHNLPSECEAVIVPSKVFAERLQNELSLYQLDKIKLLRNFVPWDIDKTEYRFSGFGWKRTPLLFFGRMDRLKNPLMLLEALKLLIKDGYCSFFVILSGPKSPEIDIEKYVDDNKLRPHVIVMPGLPFSATNKWLQLIRFHRGIFVSPSRGESFGLAAAEAICAGMPVLLSNIEEHRYLVQGYENDLLFEQENIYDLADKIVNVYNKYDVLSSAMESIKQRFSANEFIYDWSKLLSGLRV